MAHRYHDPRPLSAPVTTRVRHDLSVLFRGKIYDLGGIGLMGGQEVVITHYNWQLEDVIIISVANGSATERRYQSTVRKVAETRS